MPSHDTDSGRSKEDRRRRQRKYIIAKERTAYMAHRAQGTQDQAGVPKGRLIGFGIVPSQAGVLVTCIRTKEKRCTQEMLVLFATYLPELYPDLWATAAEEEDQAEGKEAEPVGAVSLEEEIAREVAELKRPLIHRFFTPLPTLTECMVFFQTAPGIDPVALVNHVIRDLAKSQAKPTRFANRLIPVTDTCLASLPDITKMAKSLLAPAFHQPDNPSRTFAIIPKIRNNQKVDRTALIETVAGLVGPAHTVNLEDPAYFIIVEVLKSVCMMSVVTDYYRYRKYNLFSLCDPSRKEEKAVER
ncbi:hypothetical protein IWQ60_011069 [Tieghemiomyces parasiticus]|uniref:THUMP domain-containing protein n=1 Tax=Tieghemiomyces parasiticus TaxID=78921 RepID=A0A9W8DLY2_9FUNG|nr:hypothetical protein IWQ60_011069 [Tieghemiomyces parasiticus]